MVKGSDIVLSLLEDGVMTKVASSRGCTMDIHRNKIAVANPFNGKHKKYKQTTMGATIKIDCLIARAEHIVALNAKIDAGEPIAFLFEVGGGLYYSGELIIDGSSLGGPLNQLATYGVECTVNGKWETNSLPEE